MNKVITNRDAIEPRFDVTAFSVRQNKTDGDYSGGAGHKQEKRKEKHLKNICFGFAATRPRDAGDCRHTSICLCMGHMMSLQWRGVAVLNHYCLK